MRKAFTLIELLVVIAIIAVLAALLFPVFARARRTAQCTHCANNLKQIGTAVTLYKQDWGDRYPWAWRTMDTAEHQAGKPPLPDVLKTYVTDERIWQCPGDIGETFPNEPDGFLPRAPTFYLNNGSLSSYDYPGRGWSGLNALTRNPLRIKSFSMAVLSYEFRPWHGDYRSDDYYIASPGLYNVLYCDGHVARRTAHQFNIEDMAASLQ